MKKRKKINRYIFILLLCVILFFIYRSDVVQKKFFYPLDYKADIVENAKKNTLDSMLVASVIKTESNFNVNARSNVGAVGLMQLLPDTALWASKQMGWRGFDEKMLFEPQKNITIGTWYLAELLKEFHGNEVLALAAYNAGRGNVKDWMNEYKWSYSFSDVNKIPFAETREFVNKVLREREKYRKLYVL